MKAPGRRRKFTLRQCIFIYTLFYLCIFIALWYHLKPTSSSYFSSSTAPLKNYRIPDVDGTNTSCRCDKGPQMYIWPPPNGSKDLSCSDSTYDLTLCVRVDPTKSLKRTLIQERILRLTNRTGGEADKSDDWEELAHEGKELLWWYQLEGSKTSVDQGYEMYPLAINLTETIKAINGGSPAPFSTLTHPHSGHYPNDLSKIVLVLPLTCTQAQHTLIVYRLLRFPLISFVPHLSLTRLNPHCGFINASVNKVPGRSALFSHVLMSSGSAGVSLKSLRHVVCNAAPITNPNLKILRAPRTTCSPHSTPQTSTSQLETYDLIVVYRSAIFHFDDRERIRAETKDLPSGVQVVFSVGQPRNDGGGSLFHMNGGFDLQLPERSGSVAESWANRTEEAKRLLHEESDKYGDIIIGDFVDTYVNLTYKVLTVHRWASAFCQVNEFSPKWRLEQIRLLNLNVKLSECISVLLGCKSKFSIFIALSILKLVKKLQTNRHRRTDVFLFLDDDYVFNANNILGYLKGFSREERRQMLRGPLMTWRH
ncbi:hypothetical protein ACTXT7_015438, partial [Hymenolepis weldensis]